MKTLRKAGHLRSAGLLALAGLSLSGCSKPDDPFAVSPPVQTFVLQSSSEIPFRRFPGEVAAQQTSRLSFDVAGRMVERPATQGLVVRKGGLLARLDPVNFQTRLDAAQAEFDTALQEFTRRRTLLERNVISRSEFEQFQTAFQVAEANLRTAQQAFDDTRLNAPFEGRVAQTLIDNLQNVQAKEAVLVFQDIAALEVDIQLPEADMSAIDRGVTADNARDRLEAAVEFPALPGERFPLELKSFSTAATPTARTFRVTFTLQPPEDRNILPGMTCTVLMRPKQAAVGKLVEPGIFELPVQAISTAEGGSWTWRLDPQSLAVTRLPVEMLGVTGTSMRVRSPDLAEGDELVLTGVRFLSEGMTVRRMPPPNR